MDIPIVKSRNNACHSISRPTQSPIRVDDVGDNTYYVGWAAPGSLENQTVWKIKRVQKIGTIWRMGFPDADESHKFRWIDRTTLSYF